MGEVEAAMLAFVKRRLGEGALSVTAAEAMQAIVPPRPPRGPVPPGLPVRTGPAATAVRTQRRRCAGRHPPLFHRVACLARVASGPRPVRATAEPLYGLESQEEKTPRGSWGKPPES
jgi:hypothetical protein